VPEIENAMLKLNYPQLYY